MKPIIGARIGGVAEDCLDDESAPGRDDDDPAPLPWAWLFAGRAIAVTADAIAVPAASLTNFRRSMAVPPVEDWILGGQGKFLHRIESIYYKASDSGGCRSPNRAVQFKSGIRAAATARFL